MLKGIDISSYNGTSFNAECWDFYIIKATEGMTYYNPYCDRQYDMIHGSSDGRPDKNKLYGFYHYARPENNTPEEEAKWFLSKVGHHAGNCIYALDWEGTAEAYGIDWALRWLEYVYKQTGVKPLFYANENYVTRHHNFMQKLLQGDYGLWIAKYSSRKPNTGVYPFYAMWQYTSKPQDTNWFNGSKETFRKYCKVVR